MARVYRAKDSVRQVAIKMILAEMLHDPDLVNRFQDELKVTANLHHPNIVTVYEWGTEKGNPFIVMEFLDGLSLDKVRSEADNPQLLLYRKLDFIVQLCNGLQYAHSNGVIHRDIKPANVMVLRDGTVKLIDFGIARVCDTSMTRAGVTRDGQLIGTLDYMSPEQLDGTVIDHRTDIYSTGVVLYRTLTEALPFHGADATSTVAKILHAKPKPLSEYVSDYPPELDEILGRALAKNRLERFPSADEFGMELSSVQSKLKRSFASQYIAKAEACIENSDWTGARNQLLELINIDRRHERANELLREVQQILRRNQRLADAHELRSQAEQRLAQRDFNEALSLIEQAVRLDDTDLGLRMFRDQIRETSERHDKSCRALTRAESLVQAQQFDDALIAASEALALEPEHTKAREIHSLITRNLTERSRRQQITTLIQEIRKEISAKRFTSALELLKRAASIEPNSPEIEELNRVALSGREQERRRNILQRLTTEAQELTALKQFDLALERVNRALQEYPDDPTTLDLQATIEKQRAAEERRNRIALQLRSAYELVESGDFQAAIQLLETAAAESPNDPSLKSALAQAYAFQTLKQREYEAELERAREAETQRQKRELELAQQRSEAERQLQQRAAELERQRHEQQLAKQRELELEKQRQEEESRRIEQEAEIQRQRLEAQFKKQEEAEIERQRKRAEAQKQEEARRHEAELERQRLQRSREEEAARQRAAEAERQRQLKEKAKEAARQREIELERQRLQKAREEQAARQAQAEVQRKVQLTEDEGRPTPVRVEPARRRPDEAPDSRLQRTVSYDRDTVERESPVAPRGSVDGSEFLSPEPSPQATVIVAGGRSAAVQPVASDVEEGPSAATVIYQVETGEKLAPEVTQKPPGRQSVVNPKIIAISVLSLVLIAGLSVITWKWLHRPPHPSPPTEYVVTIDSTPPNARIYIKERNLSCEAPCAEVKLPAGNYTVEGTLDKYQTTTQSIRIPEQGGAVHITLSPVPPPLETHEVATPHVSLAILTNPGLTITVDGEAHKVGTDGTIAVDVPLNSKHDIRAQKEGYKPIERSIQVGAKNMRVSLPPLQPLQDLATMRIAKAPPNSTVLVDGQAEATIGKNGTATFQIPSGTHSFALQTPNGNGAAVSRNLKPGEKASLDSLPAPPAKPSLPTDTTETDWTSVKDSKDVSTLQSFIDRHPSSSYVDTARTKIDQLDWNAASNGHRRSDYEGYLNKHPNGQFAQECRDAITDLDWQQVRDSKNPIALQAFADAHPKYKAEALAKIPELRTPAPDAHPDTHVEESDSRDIWKVLETFATAFRTKDAQTIRSVWPNLSDKNKQNFTDTFQNSESIEFAFTQKGEPVIIGSVAHVTCTVTTTYHVQGRAQTSSKPWVFTLNKSKSGQWFIDKIKN